ncbi:MAG: hypothetical protein OJI67_02255 [Prosthecobacter sp.]|nr:hypothetical protein [Prosthecobacter sp.]
MTRPPSSSSFSQTIFSLLIALFVCGLAPTLRASADDDAEEAAQALARDQESAGYMFRAEAWVGPLDKDIGKAVRMQLFKGNEYCIGVAVPKKSGVQVTGAVLDFKGDPVGEIQPVLDGWGFLLFFKPSKTGVYVVTIRQGDEGKHKDTSCAIITGYK